MSTTWAKGTYLFVIYTDGILLSGSDSEQVSAVIEMSLIPKGSALERLRAREEVSLREGFKILLKPYLKLTSPIALNLSNADSFRISDISVTCNTCSLSEPDGKLSST